MAPVDTVIIPDGAALSTFQYFENVRNFLVAVEELGIPKFEVCDLEKVYVYITVLILNHRFMHSFVNKVIKF